MKGDGVWNAIRWIWSGIQGALRVILFFSTILVIAIQSFWLFYIQTLDSKTSSLKPCYNTLQVNLVIIILLSLYGCFASFFNRPDHLKVFSILTAINCLVIIFVVMSSVEPSPKSASDKSLIQQLADYSKHYNWNLDRTANPGDNLTNLATDRWDDIQSKGICCGIFGIDSWDKVRPSDLKDLYPPSCCPEYNAQKAANKLEWCSKNDAKNRIGCLSKLNFEEDFMIILAGITVVIGILQSIASFLVSRREV